jgi:hypothetical protein
MKIFPTKHNPSIYAQKKEKLFQADIQAIAENQKVI